MRVSMLLQATAALAFAFCLAGEPSARAEDAMLRVTVKNGQFQPSELRAPVNQAFVIVIKNEDAKPMEFESVALKVEKVIAAKGQGSIRIRPLGPGRYDFFDDFNQNNRGSVVIQ